jgi:hypothetical protein
MVVRVPVDDHRLVFVGGLHRSGTSPLTRVLAAHPQISGFAGTGVPEDEGQHLQDVYPSARVHGGPGRFAHSPGAHLTEGSTLATPESADRLWGAWSAHWDLSRPVLVEKSPPNLLMTRFLQALFPNARFLVIVRHPAAVALSTRKWRRTTALHDLVEHWVTAHETFLADAPSIRALHVVTYEHLVAHPHDALPAIADFLEVDGPLSSSTLQADRSDGYRDQWSALAQTHRPWTRRSFTRMLDELEPRVRPFGYSLRDLSTVGQFPVAR